jgi:hypothetical protein
MTNSLTITAVLAGCAAVGIAAALAPASSRAQEPLTAEMQQEVGVLEEKIDRFFKQLTDKSVGPEFAVREIIANGPLKERTDDTARLIEQALILEKRYGSYTGHEAVSTKVVGKDLVFFRYLYKGEKFPVVWYFTFYRTATASIAIKREWTLIALRFDSKIEGLDR